MSIDKQIAEVYKLLDEVHKISATIIPSKKKKN